MPINAEEELAATTYMVARDENAPALLFENIEGDTSGTRILSNMLGASNRRFALAVGLDPNLSTRELILSTREISQRRIEPVSVPADTSPVNEVVLTGDDIDLTKLPVPQFGLVMAESILGQGTLPSPKILNLAV